MNAENYFSTEEQERIRRAVIAAESKTAGEIVPMIVTASARYTEMELLGFATGACIGTLAAFLWGDPWGSRSVYFWPLIAGTTAFLLCRIPALKRRLLPRQRIDDAVLQRSLAAFSAEGLHRTKDHSGVLIFVSLLEHEVEVLADSGINEGVSPGTWDEIVHMVTNGLKTGHACDGLCAAIERCGEILAHHFPRAADDRDELANQIVTDQ